MSLMRPEPAGAPGGDERPRQDVSGDHREGDRHRHRPEEERPQAGHQGQGRQDQERAERRDQLGQGDLAGPEVGRLFGRGSQAQMPVRVLQADDRAVGQRPDRQRQAAERHHVDRLASHQKAGDGRQDRDRDRRHGDGRHPPLAQEDQDDERAEDRAEHALFHQALDRPPDVDRLVHHDLQVDPAASHPGLHRLQGALERVDDLEGAGPELAEDGDVDLATAVDPHDVGLDVVGVLGRADVAEVGGVARARCGAGCRPSSRSSRTSSSSRWRSRSRPNLALPVGRKTLESSIAFMTSIGARWRAWSRWRSR